MHQIPLQEDARVTLPRADGIAYHAQEPWILNDTIRVCSSSSDVLGQSIP